MGVVPGQVDEAARPALQKDSDKHALILAQLLHGIGGVIVHGGVVNLMISHPQHLLGNVTPELIRIKPLPFENLTIFAFAVLPILVNLFKCEVLRLFLFGFALL